VLLAGELARQRREPVGQVPGCGLSAFPRGLPGPLTRPWLSGTVHRQFPIPQALLELHSVRQPRAVDRDVRPVLL